jgi:antitoxin (DNA-binding transcriptional repressor) of toxin-antitoxin stability system
MKFVTVRELRNDIGKVRAALAAEKDVVLTCSGKPFAVLSEVTEDQLETHLGNVRRARGLAALAAIQAASARRGLDKLTLREINAEIKATRKAMGR